MQRSEKSAIGVTMSGADDDAAQAHDSANLDLKHLGQAPVRASRHRIQVQSPQLHTQYQAFVTPKSQTEEQFCVKSDSPPIASSSILTRAESDVPFHCSNSIMTERKYLGQAPARAQSNQLADMRNLQNSIFGKSPTTAELSARKIDARDLEHRTSMHNLLQQLDEMSVSKQRITEEFRASQQLTAQALRRLDEECERRQQLQLRVIETEASLKIMGRICEEKTEELESVRARLEMSECRAAKLEQQMSAPKALRNSPIENESTGEDGVPAQSEQLSDTELDVSNCLEECCASIT
jgi:hypothetical protein